MLMNQTLYFAFCITFGCSVVTAASAAVGRLTEQSEIFVDEVRIHQMNGLRKTLHPATKLDRPVVEADKPWEKGRAYLYGTVHFEEETGLFRMWYMAGGLAYAESKDGIRWGKPALSLHEHNGRPTNLLMTGNSVKAVLVDHQEPDPNKRYKAINNLGHRNFIGFYSADGLRWHTYEQNPLIPFGSELANVIRDPASGLYFAYIRPYLPRFHPKNEREKRLIALTTSPDFVTWSQPEIIITPDEIDDQWVENDEQRTEFYSMAGFPYGTQYLGLLTVFRITEILEEKEPRQSKYEGPIDVQLVHSRDGRQWQRTRERTPIIPTGPHDYDAGCIMDIASKPVIFEDQIFYYYTAVNTTHGGTIPPKRQTIGLARWRLDGFASLDAGPEGGILETKPWTAEEGKLTVNADLSDGELRVELLDPVSGRAWPGYGLAESVPISGDSIRHLVRWQEEAFVPTDRPFRIRFHLTEGSLYSYRLTK